MSTHNVISPPGAADVARIVQQLADFLARGNALHADITAFANELPGDAQWDDPSVTWRTLAHLRRNLADCLGMFRDAVDGYLVPPGDDADLSTRAHVPLRTQSRKAYPRWRG